MFDDWRRPALVASSAYDGLYVWAERWDWDGDIATRGRAVEVRDDAVDGTVWQLESGPGGERERVLRGEVRGMTFDGRDLLGDDAGATAASAAFEELIGVRTGEVVWDWRIQRVETTLAPSGELEARLASGLHRAVVGAVTASGVERPFVVQLRQNSVDGPGPLPGFVRIGSERFRDRARRFASEDGAAVDALYAGTPPDVVLLDLAGTCDDDTLQDACRTDRAALATWLAQRHLDDPEALAHDVAEAGFRLRTVPASDGVRSRLHGGGLLPPGEPWPRTGDERALTFLAAVDLSELTRTIPGDDALPRNGWLLFFADIDDPEEAGTSKWYGEPVPNVPGSPARVLRVAGGADPVAADAPPDALAAPRPAVPVRAVHQLTLPDSYDAPHRLGIQPPASAAYEEIAGTLRRAGESSDDWVLGAVSGVQGAEPASDTALLLHLATVEFQDGGALQFRIPRAALADEDWAQAHAEGDSH